MPAQIVTDMLNANRQAQRLLRTTKAIVRTQGAIEGAGTLTGDEMAVRTLEQELVQRGLL